jgi:hypothetical protein
MKTVISWYRDLAVINPARRNEEIVGDKREAGGLAGGMRRASRLQNCPRKRIFAEKNRAAKAAKAAA